jgi:hypothetical protein
MTTTHLTPAPGLRLPRVSGRGRATPPPFFEPGRDGLSRDAEGAGESAQTAALVIGAQYLFALLLAVSVSARLFTTGLRAIAAQIPLAAIRSEAVTH